MGVFLKNNGQPWQPPERRRAFRLPGWSQEIPLDGRIEVNDQMLRTMLRPEGPENAQNFAEFVAGVYNRSGQPEWLTVVIEPPPDPVPDKTDDPDPVTGDSGGGSDENDDSPPSPESESDDSTSTTDPTTEPGESKASRVRSKK